MPWRCCRRASPRARSPARRRSAPWRSSTSWSRRSAGPMAAPWATSATRATSTPASPSARSSATGGARRCRSAPASSPTPIPRRNGWRRAPRREGWGWRCGWRRLQPGHDPRHRHIQLLHLEPRPVPRRAGRRAEGRPQRRAGREGRRRARARARRDLARPRNSGPGGHLHRADPPPRADHAGARRLPGPPGDRPRLRRDRRTGAAPDARQDVLHQPRRPRRVRRTAQPVRRHALTFSGDPARHGPGGAGAQRLVGGRRDHGYPPSPLPDRGRAVPPRVDTHGGGQAAPGQLPRTMTDRLTESRLIQAVRRHAAAGAGVRVGIGDDCAVLEPEAGAALLATTDLLLEDVHFRRRYTEPADIGWKSLAVNVSDIASMGGRSRWALVALACPASTTLEGVEAFYAGTLALADEHDVSVVGGDTSTSPAGWLEIG